jgi:hypothetical protein
MTNPDDFAETAIGAAGMSKDVETLVGSIVDISRLGITGTAIESEVSVGWVGKGEAVFLAGLQPTKKIHIKLSSRIFIGNKRYWLCWFCIFYFSSPLSS